MINSLCALWIILLIPHIYNVQLLKLNVMNNSSCVLSTSTHLKRSLHCYCKVIFSPWIFPLTDQNLIAYSALRSRLLGDQFFPNHLGGNSFCFFWTIIRKRIQILLFSTWKKSVPQVKLSVFNNGWFKDFCFKNCDLWEDYLHSSFEATCKRYFTSAAS